MHSVVDIVIVYSDLTNSCGHCPTVWSVPGPMLRIFWPLGITQPGICVGWIHRDTILVVHVLENGVSVYRATLCTVMP